MTLDPAGHELWLVANTFPSGPAGGVVPRIIHSPLANPSAFVEFSLAGYDNATHDQTVAWVNFNKFGGVFCQRRAFQRGGRQTFLRPLPLLVLF